jgi:multidrug efflux pump subunit AcrA (membrane-fusion protein)
MTNRRFVDSSYRLLFVALAGALFLLSACLSPVRTLPTPTPWPTPTVSARTVYTVERATLTNEIEFNGEVVPLVWEPLSFRTQGALGTIHKLEGDIVAEGDLLAELEMPDLTEALEQAQVVLERAQDSLADSERQRSFALQRAELELRKAEILLETVRRGGDPNAIQLQEIGVQLAQLAVDEQKSAIDPALERTITQAQLEVDALQRQIEDRRLRAPYDGAVIAIGIDIQGVRSVGSRPQPHTPISAYTPFMVVAQLEPLIVVTAKDTSGVAELTMGQTVTVTHRLARDEPFGGEVSALPAFNSGGAKKPGFQDHLQIAIDAEHPPMKIGDFVQVRVLLAVHTDTLVLPDAAVRRFAGRTFVIVQDGERERRIDIKTGLEADGQVEILEGIEEGDVVIGL